MPESLPGLGFHKGLEFLLEKGDSIGGRIDRMSKCSGSVVCENQTPPVVATPQSFACQRSLACQSASTWSRISDYMVDWMR
jgi:hypothetical protein